MALVNYIGDGDGAGLTESGITATGTTQATAYLLRAENSDVSTVSSGSGVVVSNHLSPGRQQLIFNSGSNALKVYPRTGLQINALPLNAAMLLPTNTGVLLQCISTTRIFGVLSA